MRKVNDCAGTYDSNGVYIMPDCPPNMMIAPDSNGVLSLYEVEELVKQLTPEVVEEVFVEAPVSAEPTYISRAWSYLTTYKGVV